MIIEQVQFTKSAVERNDFTEQEAKVALLIAWGFTKKEIANELNISEFTVDNHAKKVYKKAGVNSIGQLSAWWFCKTYNVPATDKPELMNMPHFDFGDYGILSYGFTEN